MVERLVATGELRSSMAEPEEVAKQIADQLYSGHSGQIFSPPHMGLASGVRAFPHWVQEQLRMGLSASVKEATVASMKND